MTHTTRTFRIFISSTFSDLKAERNALQEHVFPRLRQLAEAHGCRFQAIDLRWGVSEEAALDQQTMKICLGEIQRCQHVSPRPNFLILLGDRYGWRPLPYEIPAQEFEQVFLHVPPEERPLLLYWYRRDDNAVPPEYVLQPRSGLSADYEVWEQIEGELHAILETAASNASHGAASLGAASLVKYSASATEQEIIHGAFLAGEARKNIHCFVRTIQDLPAGGRAAGYSDPGNAAEAARRLDDLKSRLQAVLGDNYHAYRARWQCGGPSLEHLEGLCADVYASLEKVMLEELQALEQVEPLQKEIAAHLEFGRQRGRLFTGRQELLKTIDGYLLSENDQPLAIWGLSGSGKSALLAKAALEAEKSYPGARIVVRFLGATPDSSNGRSLLEGLCRQISRLYAAGESDLPADFKQLALEFQNRLALASPASPLLLFLDGLDQLSEHERARSLVWLPQALPKGVRMLLTSLPGECTRVLEAKLRPGNLLQIPVMPAEQGSRLLDLWLAEAGRTLQPQQRDLINARFARSGLPLYLKLAFEAARTWRSYQPAPALAADVPGLIRELFARLSEDAQHGKLLVERVLGYLAAAKNGLSEDELLEILSADPQVRADFVRRSPRSPGVSHLPVVVWSRLLLDLGAYLAERSADGAVLLGFYHAQIRQAAEEEALAGAARKERHAALARYFQARDTWIQHGAQRLPAMRKAAELAYQQAHAGYWQALETTLSDYACLRARLEGFGPFAVQEDFDLLALYTSIEVGDWVDLPALHEIQEALKMCTHILGRQPAQLAGQLHGRLLAKAGGGIQRLLAGARDWERQPWLCPEAASLRTPGGALKGTLAGHSQAVTCVAASRDSNWIASGSLDGSLRIWNLRRGSEAAVLPGHPGGIRSVLFTPDARRAIAGCQDGMIYVWDWESAVLLATLHGHSAAVLGLACTPDGRRLVSVSADRGGQVWDLESTQPLVTLAGHSAAVNAAAIAPGNRVLSASSDGSLRLWELETGLESARYQAPWPQYAVQLSPDGRWAISGSELVPLLWNLESHAMTILTAYQGPLHEGNVLGAAFTPDGRWALCAADDGALKAWDLQAAYPLRGAVPVTLGAHAMSVRGLAVTPNGKWAVSASGDCSLRTWSLSVLDEAQSPSAELAASGPAPGGPVRWCGFDTRRQPAWLAIRLVEDPLGYEDAEWFSSLYFNGKQLDWSYRARDVAHSAGLAQLWLAIGNEIVEVDLQSGDRRRVGPYGITHRLCISPDGRFLLSDDGRGALHLVEAQTNQEIRQLAVKNSPVEALAITADSRWGAAGRYDGAVIFWNLGDPDQFKAYQGHDAAVQHLAALAGNRLVSCGADGWLKVWDPDAALITQTLQPGWQKTAALVPSPDARRLAAVSQQGAVAVWDLESGRLLAALPDGSTNPAAHTRTDLSGRPRQSLALYASRPWALLLRGDSLSLYELDGGVPLASFSADEAFEALSLSADETQIIAGTISGRLHRLRVEV